MTRIITIVVTALTLCLSVPAAASRGFQEIKEDHWLAAMRVARIDSEILYAISLMESGTSFNGMRQYGPWPWTMNINEEARYYSSREAARMALIEEVERGNNRIAVGIWQIYLRFNGHHVDDPLELFDPVTNLRVAAKVLNGCWDHYDTLRNVLSCYHSGDVDEKGLAYAARVLKLAEKWGEPYRVRNRIPGIVYARDVADQPLIDNNALLANDMVVHTEPQTIQTSSRGVRRIAIDNNVPTFKQPDDGVVRRVIVVE